MKKHVFEVSNCQSKNPEGRFLAMKLKHLGRFLIDDRRILQSKYDIFFHFIFVLFFQSILCERDRERESLITLKV